MRGCVAELRDLIQDSRSNPTPRLKPAGELHFQFTPIRTRRLEALSSPWINSVDSFRRLATWPRSSSHITPLQSLLDRPPDLCPMLDRPVENAVAGRASAMASYRCARCASAIIATVFTTSIAAPPSLESACPNMLTSLTDHAVQTSYRGRRTPRACRDLATFAPDRSTGRTDVGAGTSGRPAANHQAGCRPRSCGFDVPAQRQDPAEATKYVSQ